MVTCDPWIDVVVVSVRCLVLRQVGIVLGSWTKPELEPYFDRLRDFLHDAMYDRNGCIRMAARAAFCNFCDVWSEHMDDLVHIPHMGNLFVAFHPRHSITTALTYGPTSVVQELGEEEDVVEDMVEDAVAGARADEALDVHLSVVIYLLVFLTSTLWSLPLLVGHLWWSMMGVSSKSQVMPIVVHAHDPLRDGLLSEDQRYQDQLRPAENSDLDKDHSRVSDKANGAVYRNAARHEGFLLHSWRVFLEHELAHSFSDI
ncbi:hypothetical protein LEN26_007114 [Aphanomyces euteiches]|nr:hypothetical protein LEN26_007114 [Aphanomyces euteiches]